MRRSFWIVLVLGVLALLALSGCSLLGSSAAAEAGPSATATQVPPTAIPPTATSVHQEVPGELPAEHSSLAGDYDSSRTAQQRRAPGGDRFTFDRFERPFNADTMDVYYPYLDIQQSVVYQDDTWIFAVITLKDWDENQTLPGRYAAEFDIDQDGRGDWLVLVDAPTGTDWTTDGVSVWYDSNNDVGGATPVDADQDAYSDGYETQAFGNGQGDDPDMAWARLDPQEAHTVQLAVKNTILDGDQDYMVGMWAGGALLEPASFDLNDRFTHEQAGAAQTEFEYFYPIKALDQLDNSCRTAVGFTPSGDEPGLCPTAGKESNACTPDQFVCYYIGQREVCLCMGN